MNIVGTNSQSGCKKIWLRVVHSFGGFLTRKKLAKLLDQYFGPNDTCEEVAVGTVACGLPPRNYVLTEGAFGNDSSMTDVRFLGSSSHSF